MEILSNSNQSLDCKVVAVLKADLSSVSPSEFERVESGSGSYYKVLYDIEMSFEATISFHLLFKGTCSPFFVDSEAIPVLIGAARFRQDHGRSFGRLWPMNSQQEGGWFRLIGSEAMEKSI